MERYQPKFRDLWLLLFFRPTLVEHFIFDNSRHEYLLVTLQSRLPFWHHRITTVEASIGLPSFGRYFKDFIRELEKRGAVLAEDEFTLEEFTDFSCEHPILQKDDWVQMRRRAVENKIAIR